VQITLVDSLLAGGGEAAQIDIIALDSALESLANHDARQAKVVELRYFGGLSIEETGDALGDFARDRQSGNGRSPRPGCCAPCRVPNHA
jgi:hypothetical protein